MGQEEDSLVAQVLVACFCAIPLNTDILLEVQEHLETHPGPSGVAPSTLYLPLRRSLAYVTHAILHPGYRVGLIANYGRSFHSVQKVFCDLSSVVP